MRIRTLALVGGGLAAAGLLANAIGRRASRTAQEARSSLSDAGWGPENMVPLRVGMLEGRPRFVATVATDDSAVKLGYLPDQGGWVPVACISDDGTRQELPETARGVVVRSRQELALALKGGSDL